MVHEPSTLTLVPPVTERLLITTSLIIAIPLWLAFLLIPVNWSISSVPPAGSVINIGPVSAYQIPGQTIFPHEEVGKVAILIRVGGPFGSTIPIDLRVFTEVGGDLLSSATTSATSIPSGFDLVIFELDQPIPGSHWAYLQVQIPSETEWPIIIGGTKSNLSEFPGQLFLRDQAGWEDQDLFHQLLRYQNLASRIPTIWMDHRATLLGYIFIGIFALIFFAGLGCAAGNQRPLLRWPLAIIPLPLITTSYYFYAFL